MSATESKIRADARRNRDALLAAGYKVFRTRGAEASMDDISKEAGVGKGTIYRHFPSKDHLIAAILQEHFDALGDRASELMNDPDPAHALATWLREFDKGPTRLPALRDRIPVLFGDGSAPVSEACRPINTSFRRLLRRAQDAGVVRGDINSRDLLRMVAALPHAGRDAEGASPMLDVVLRGIVN